MDSDLKLAIVTYHRGLEGADAAEGPAERVADGRAEQRGEGPGRRASDQCSMGGDY